MTERTPQTNEKQTVINIACAINLEVSMTLSDNLFGIKLINVNRPIIILDAINWILRPSPSENNRCFIKTKAYISQSVAVLDNALIIMDIE